LRVLPPSHPDVLALREAKQVALRSARVPLGVTRNYAVSRTLTALKRAVL